MAYRGGGPPYGRRRGSGGGGGGCPCGRQSGFVGLTVSSASSAAAVAKEVAKDVFVFETAQEGKTASAEEAAVDPTPFSKKRMAHRPGVGTVVVADKNLSPYDIHRPSLVELSRTKDQLRTGRNLIPTSQQLYSLRRYKSKDASRPCLQAGSHSHTSYSLVKARRMELSNTQLINLLKGTCEWPQGRERSIRDMVLRKECTKGEFVQKGASQVCTGLVSAPAHVLHPPSLKYHDSGTEKVAHKGTVDSWTCLNFSCMRLGEVQRFCMDLILTCNANGMNLNPNPVVEIKSADPNNDVENALMDVCKRAKNMLADHLELLIVMLPEGSGSYGKIISACEADTGFVSQFFFPRRASRPSKQYLADVAAVIKCKVDEHYTVLNGAIEHIDIVLSTEAAPSSSTAKRIIMKGMFGHHQKKE